MALKSVIKRLSGKSFREAETRRLAAQKAALESGNVAAYYAAMPDPTPSFWLKYRQKEEKRVAFQEFMDSLSWR